MSIYSSVLGYVAGSTIVAFEISSPSLEFEKLYGVEKIHAGTLFAKDLKERYSFLWLYYDLFFTREAGQRICEK